MVGVQSKSVRLPVGQEVKLEPKSLQCQVEWGRLHKRQVMEQNGAGCFFGFGDSAADYLCDREHATEPL